jgi:hypothetical protein
MVANPYTQAVDWSTVRVTDGTDTLSVYDGALQGWLNANAYVWDVDQEAYTVVAPDGNAGSDTVGEWEGFWVLQMDDSKSLELLFSEPGQPKRRSEELLYVSRYGDEARPRARYEQPGLGEWSGILYLYTEDGTYTALDQRFGVHPNATDEFDGLDASWLGPGFATEYGVLYFITAGGYEFVYDIRGSDWEEQTWHFKVEDHNVNGNWVLRWPNLAGIPGNIALSLESPQGTTVVPDLRESPSYRFSLTSGGERDFYLHAVVIPDSVSAGINLGFVQNPEITKFLDLYLFPDEPLLDVSLFVDGNSVALAEIDNLYNLYRGRLEMQQGGTREVVVHTVDVSANLGIDTLAYNFVLVGGVGGPLVVSAPGSGAELVAPGAHLSKGTWIGLGREEPRDAEGLSPVYSVQPFGLGLPEGSELVWTEIPSEMELSSVMVARETAAGWEPVAARYDISSGTIRAVVRQSGRYQLRRRGAGEIGGLLPERVTLGANYPNPFNAVTMIPYGLPAAGRVTVTVYDLLGREVVRLVQGHQEAGYYRVRWNGKDGTGRPVSSGMYLVVLRTSDQVLSRKLLLLK